MAVPVKSTHRELFVRRCVACGYDGAMLRGGQAERCARCGCDLRERPARSYAEMEGLVGHPITIESPLQPDQRRQRLIQRWMAFIFLVTLGLIVMAYLVSATLP